VTHSGKPPVTSIQTNKIVDFIKSRGEAVGIRNIMIGIHTKDRSSVKQAIKKLEKDGKIERAHGKKYVLSGYVPRVTIIEITGTDDYGEVIAKPLNWNNGTPPIIHVTPTRNKKIRQIALGRGDRALARLQPSQDSNYNASIIKKLDVSQKSILGIYHDSSEGGMLKPTDRKNRFDFIVAPENINGAKSGDLVIAEIQTGRKLGRGSAIITEILHFDLPIGTKGNQPYTKIALHDHDIPYIFSKLAIKQADTAVAAPLDNRDDLRDISLITIDDEDARDFDDAVFAERDIDKKNSGGWHLIVAIADVSWYVRPGDELDKNAFERGNSVYFPDQVVPMLPEALSNGWCSLVPNEERPCLAVHMWIDANGNALRHQFTRGIMKSHARLTYNQVQAAIEGSLDSKTSGLIENIIKPLYGAYDALCRNRMDREPLDLDLPEQKITLDAKGAVFEIITRPRHNSHKLIEEFMIAANVAAATTLEGKKQLCLYRIHQEPPAKNLENYRNFLKGIGFVLSKGQVLLPRNFNQILKKAKQGEFFDAVSQMTLRSQSQATYSGKNIGHFGLALRRYCHFTSPIRRYSDLFIHRALISGLELGKGAAASNPNDIEKIGEHLSTTERRASAAERDVINRFSAAYLSGKIGDTFSGKINGVTKFGLFITLDDINADGLVPIRSLPNDYYNFDEKRMALKGSRNGKIFHLGMKIQTILKEANPISGSLLLSLAGSSTPFINSTASKKKKTYKHRKKYKNL
jgi:ribonuclease R